MDSVNNENLPDMSGENPGNPPAKKRRRRRKKYPGGQPGNRNARKNGSFSSVLTPSEEAEYLSIIHNEGLEAELTWLRVKLQSVIRDDPANLRAVKLLSNRMVPYFRWKLTLKEKNTAALRKYINLIMQQLINESARAKYELSMHIESFVQDETSVKKRIIRTNRIDPDKIFVL